MKARILNSEFNGIYTNDFIIKYWDEEINGQLVSEWQLTEVLPNKNFIKPIWNGTEWIEGLTPEELIHQLQQRALEIDLEYTGKISKLMSKHNDKFIEGIINGVPYNIPQDILDERQRLKNECNQLILDLGITDFSYRQSHLQLKK